jgi:PAS domain S-box-containing protein
MKKKSSQRPERRETDPKADKVTASNSSFHKESTEQNSAEAASQPGTGAAQMYAEQALHQSEERYRELFENASEGIFQSTPEGTYITVNPSFARMYGFSSPQQMIEEVTDIGQQLYANPEDRERVKQLLEDPGYIARLETEFRRRDGETIWAYINARAVRDAQGKTLYFAGMTEDITERKRAEEKLKQSELRFRTVADFNYDWETWRGPDGTYVYVSPSCERISGYRPEEFMDDPDLLIRIAHPDDRDALISHVEEELISEHVMKLEFRIIDRNGSEHWISHICQPVHKEDGTSLGPRASNRDITERKKAEAELSKHRDHLEELVRERTAELEKLNNRLRIEISEREMAEKELLRLNEELGAYAQTVSHELRTPLAGIWLALEYLERISGELSTERFQEEAKGTVLKAKSTVKKADEEVKHLLELAEAGQVPTEVSDVDVSSVVDGILLDIEEEVTRLGARVELDGDLGMIKANETHIHQLFSNLIVNAIRHCDSREPHIEIALLGEDSDAGHRYLVQDNGSGIPPELMGRLFSPFVKGEGGGSGTGLAIVEKIVKIYNGSIRAYNNNGACFEFMLHDYPRSGVPKVHI